MLPLVWPGSEPFRKSYILGSKTSTLQKSSHWSSGHIWPCSILIVFVNCMTGLAHLNPDISTSFVPGRTDRGIAGRWGRCGRSIKSKTGGPSVSVCSAMLRQIHVKTYDRLMPSTSRRSTREPAGNVPSAATFVWKSKGLYRLDWSWMVLNAHNATLSLQ